MERIRGLEAALRQRDSSLQKLNLQLHSKDMQYLQLHAGPDAHSEWPWQPPPWGQHVMLPPGRQGAVSSRYGGAVVVPPWRHEEGSVVVPSGVCYRNSGRFR